MAGWQDDPVVGAAPAASGGGWQNDPIVGGATAQASTDASSKMSGIGRTLENALTLGGADWLYSKVPGMPSLETQKAQTAAAEQSVPAVIRYPAEIGAYAVGPGKFLGAAGAAMGGGPIAAGALEGAMAGGLSSGFGSNFDPTTTGMGAAGGAALGGVAGGIGKGVAKLTATPGSVDPAAAIAKTAKDSADAYAKLHQVPADPQAITGALKGALTDLDPSVVTGMSPGLKSTIVNIGQTVQNLPEANMGQINSWQRQINAAAQRERHPTDQIVAAKISSALDGVIQQGGASDLNAAAQAAAQKNIMAENLAEWQRKAANEAPLGQAPLTEAENWYQKNGQPQPGYQDLVDLYKQSQSQQDPSWALSHLAGHALGTAGYAMGGFPGSMIGEAAGVLGVKPMIKKMFKGSRQNATVKNIQQLYPQFTGMQPTGAQPGLQVGDMVKNLMLGTAF